MEYTEEDSGVLYEHVWRSERGDEIRIEDATKILSPTEQTHLHNFDDDQYRVLEQRYLAPEAQLQETFATEDEALEYVEENYQIVK